MRETLRSAALRVFNSSVRGVIMKVTDSSLMQTIEARGLNGEYFTGVERPQMYGFNSVPVPPDQNGGKAAEALIGFRDGNRSHPYIIAEGDRRTRPKNWQPGDTGIWHYKGATARFTQDGWKQDAGGDKKPASWTVGNATFTIADGKITAQVNNTAVVVKDGLVFLGEDPDQGGTFDFVQTVSGPSVNVKAKIG